MAVLVVTASLVWLSLVITAAVKLARDYYYPYEGTVLRVETRWYDRIPFEFSTWEHLIIATPDGKIIDRLTKKEERLPNRIEPGDYVTKRKGFGSPVKPRDKETTQELLQHPR